MLPIEEVMQRSETVVLTVRVRARSRLAVCLVVVQLFREKVPRDDQGLGQGKGEGQTRSRIFWGGPFERKALWVNCIPRDRVFHATLLNSISVFLNL